MTRVMLRVAETLVVSAFAGVIAAIGWWERNLFREN